MKITGTGLPEKGYPTITTGTADTISLRLNKGTYTVTITDATNYQNNMLLQEDKKNNTPSTATLSVEATKFNSSRIEGIMSIDGSNRIMPVSMSVAEFDKITKERKTDYLGQSEDPVSKLSPDKPVWVVVHGMNSFEDTTAMESLTRELTLSGQQVVTINWSDAANDPLLPLGQDAPWTPAVGKWVASQLLNAGFSPEDINFAGHSHGTYVTYFAAEEVMDKRNGSTINAIVALDPAGNFKAISGVDEGVINFARVSRNSIAIEASLFTGSNHLASTADIAFQVDSASTHLPWNEHSLPITTFADLLRAERVDPTQVTPHLRLSSIMLPSDRQLVELERNRYRGFYEGIIEVDAVEKEDKYGDYYHAFVRKTTSKIIGQTGEDIRIVVPDSIISSPN